ncbi:replication protein [Legionella sp. CNM-1927-20]|uniref:replication protein n=1 Tax=Legionella sp. CNM-1927-20 TaxID=3422221 RepID=UPI00403A7E34
MSVLRIHKKNQNFIILDKTCLQDIKLSWSAKGLHAYLMSLPDDWCVRVADLQTRSTNGRDSVRSLLSELEQAEYISKSACRNNASGKFEGVEYIVYEIPKPTKKEKTPEPENTFSVTPQTENPATGKPTTANPTLVNNKNNNNLLNKKAAASSKLLPDTFSNQEKAAAALSDKNKLRDEQVSEPTEHQSIRFLSAEDSVIGSTLTLNQKKRVHALAQKLNSSNAQILFQEIEYCLLSSKHFIACGQDFGRKLNAIGIVISRGEWQTPPGLIFKAQEKTNVVFRNKEQELQDVRAEVIHFKRLLNDAKLHRHAREQFEAILTKAQLKISTLEKEIANLKVHAS